MAEQPQLQMARHDLAGLPPLRTPAGYEIRHYRRGDGPGWNRVFADAFERDVGPGEFERIMRGDPSFCPERIWFVVYDNYPVATASAYYRPDFHQDWGMIHYVAALSSHRGKGLGFLATLAALYRMVEEQRTGAWLSTDDDRIPAIVTYLRLGFVPLVTHESHRERWRRVFSVVDPSLETRLRRQLEAPLWKPEQTA